MYVWSINLQKVCQDDQATSSCGPSGGRVGQERMPLVHAGFWGMTEGRAAARPFERIWTLQTRHGGRTRYGPHKESTTQ